MKIYQQLMASLFAMIFQGLAFALILVAGWQFAGAWREGSEEVLSIVVSGINTLVISLAMYELGVGVGKEYDPDNSPDNAYQTVRRTISRFVGTVCSALVLEGLIMAIKYSQLDMAGMSQQALLEQYGMANQREMARAGMWRPGVTPAA